MNEFILKYKGDDANELAADIKMIKNTRNLTVIDESSGLLLVEMSDKVKESLESNLKKWSLFPKTVIDRPDTKNKLKGRAYK